MNQYTARPVYQFDSSGKLVSKYENCRVAAATNEISCSAIRLCASEVTNIACGYIWSYTCDLSIIQKRIAKLLTHDIPNLANEVWKDIIGFEGMYQISNLGRVKSLSRILTSKNGKQTYRSVRILKSCINLHGYYYVNLYKGAKQYPRQIHRLIAEAFIPNPHNYPFIDHINTVTTDNRIENLRWVTPKGNTNNSLTLAKIKESQRTLPYSVRRKRVANTMHKVCMLDANGVVLKEFECIADAAREMGVVNGAISNACLGVSSKSCGYYWRYAE